MTVQGGSASEWQDRAAIGAAAPAARRGASGDARGVAPDGAPADPVGGAQADPAGGAREDPASGAQGDPAGGAQGVAARGATGSRAPGRGHGGPFQVIPAVDLLGAEAVRLEQGDFERVSHRAGDPEELVARFAGASPPLIHVVDLEGARTGVLRPALLRRLAEAAAPVPLQASGGIRSLRDAERLLEAGAARVILGTAAFAGDDPLALLVERLDERLVVAVDVRDGRVAVRGWEQDGGLAVEEAVDRCLEAGVRRLHCTAIDRDGTLAGPDLDLLARVRDRSSLPVVAAGGIRSTDDLDALAAIGLEGAVVGRALLEGRIPLEAVSARERR